MRDGEGEFNQDKAESGEYRLGLTGDSSDEVLHKPYEPTKLVLEGYKGFNIVRQADVLFAIPQIESVFEY